MSHSVAWSPRIPLSPEEKAYLEKLPPLRVGIAPQWAPMAFVDSQGRIDGISADYLDFLRDALHVRFRFVPTRSWGETIRLANAGKIDLVVAASAFDALKPAFGLSVPYVRYPLVIVTRETAPFIGGLDDLEGAEVAMVGDAHTARFRFGGPPKLHVVTAASAEDGLRAVAKGHVFAYIGNLGVVDRIVRERYAGTLRVAAPANRIQELSFGIAPRFAPLLPLVDRVLSSIPEAQREHIQNSWLSTRFTFGVATRTLWLVLAPVGSLTFVFLAVLWFNMVRLRKEVRHRRQTEQELLFETNEVKASHAALIAAKHEAEDATRARDAFIATVSHEIRTPMSGIVGILQLLDHDGLTADDRYLVELAGNAAALSLRILNDILDFAKSENGGLSLESAPMSIADIVHRSAGLVAPEIERKGLHLHVDVSPAVALHHIGDVQRLGQVLLNLLGNAMKFTERGAVWISVEVTSETAGQQTLSLRIADTGIGISREDQARLFSPFSQASGALAARGAGTGLGLAICKRLIEQMGGSIVLASELGRGTTITLTLKLLVDRGARPAGPQRGVCPEALPQASSMRAAPRILIVDDQVINLEVLRRQLVRLNVVNCDLAEDGVRALNAYAQREYAMVITDCVMPILDGVSLIANIRRREHGTGRHTILIALTADASHKQREACIDAGADEVFVKPLSPEQLRALFDSYGMLAAPTPGFDHADARTSLLQQLRHTLRADWERLRACAQSEDREQARNVAHTIAGTASWFQLRELAETAMRIERELDEAQTWPHGSIRALELALEHAIARENF
jgi:signal transduction histidine kinase/HPt (histidine-containing phosphotransfer) domain-containing protein